MLSLVLLFPLVGFVINGFWYAFGQAGPQQKKAGATVTGMIASLAILASFGVSLSLFLQLFQMPAESRILTEHLFTWMRIADFQLDVALTVDSLSSLFLLVITGVGSLIHIYSIGYMGHDETPGKFFCYLNLFCFAMLLLVMGSSLPLLFVGWEGVGLCSYLLIGYWYSDTEKASAGKKAFIVNRIGDFGFILAAFLIYTTFGTLDFAALKDAVAHSSGVASGVLAGTITAICLLMFLGCTGKSAQIPLYVWLPDAMAGPTPVSALIHAATMVTSGIYLISRMNFLYSLSPVALSVVAWVGAITALFAATIAITQRDIKKVLAYSTVSQLGYMFLACGVGAYWAGVFHVITHAFFKALLFLGAGSVIHGMHEEQDIFKMGGLKKYMPQTYAVFTVAWLAICGVPLFSGFFSKDEILWKAFSSDHGSVFLWVIGAITALMTAFYMTRLYSLTFFGKPRFDEHHVHPHESPAVMIVPLAILALLSFAGGYIGIPHMAWLEHWLEPVIPAHHAVHEGNTEWILMGVSTVGAFVSMWFAFRMFKELSKVEAIRVKWNKLYNLLLNKWFVDEAYEATVVKPIHTVSMQLWKKVDVAIIDQIVLGFGRVSTFTGQTVRVLQNGSLQFYALMVVVGLIIFAGMVMYGLFI